MAKIFVLSALLSAVLTFHGALGISGGKVHAVGLQAFYDSTKGHWVPGLEGVLKGVLIPTLPGDLLNCQVSVVLFLKLEVHMIPDFGLHVIVCVEIHVYCQTVLSLRLWVKVKACATISLRAGLYGLIVDSCSVAYLDATLDPILSVNILLITNTLDGLLSSVFCKRALEICAELNYALEADDVAARLQIHVPPSTAPHPLLPGCQCTYRMYKPVLTSAALEFRFTPVLQCGGSSLPFPIDPDYNLPLTGAPYDIFFLMYYTAPHLTFILGFYRTNQVFDAEDNLGDTVTTTSLMAHVPEISSPPGLPIVLKIVCSEISVELHADSAFLGFTFHISVGYLDTAGFIPLLNLIVSGKFILQIAIDCPSKRLLPTVEVTSDFQITGSCEGKLCTINGDVLDSLFGLKARCASLLNVKLRIGFPLLQPRRYSCHLCQSTVYIPGFIVWPCAMRLVP